MPYPSSGCQTCRKRRIKCDETRPTCGQCIKSARECTGFKDEPGDLPWRSENVFASGMARRPRARAARQSPLSNTLSDLNVPSQKPKTGFPGARLSKATLTRLLPDQPTDSYKRARRTSLKSSRILTSPWKKELFRITIKIISKFPKIFRRTILVDLSKASSLEIPRRPVEKLWS